MRKREDPPAPVLLAPSGLARARGGQAAEATLRFSVANPPCGQAGESRRARKARHFSAGAEPMALSPPDEHGARDGGVHDA